MEGTRKLGNIDRLSLGEISNFPRQCFNRVHEWHFVKRFQNYVIYPFVINRDENLTKDLQWHRRKSRNTTWLAVVVARRLLLFFFFHISIFFFFLFRKWPAYINILHTLFSFSLFRGIIYLFHRRDYILITDKLYFIILFFFFFVAVIIIYIPKFVYKPKSHNYIIIILLIRKKKWGNFLNNILHILGISLLFNII